MKGNNGGKQIPNGGRHSTDHKTFIDNTDTEDECAITIKQ